MQRCLTLHIWKDSSVDIIMFTAWKLANLSHPFIVGEEMIAVMGLGSFKLS